MSENVDQLSHKKKTHVGYASWWIGKCGLLARKEQLLSRLKRKKRRGKLRALKIGYLHGKAWLVCEITVGRWKRSVAYNFVLFFLNTFHFFLSLEKHVYITLSFLNQFIVRFLVIHLTRSYSWLYHWNVTSLVERIHSRWGKYNYKTSWKGKLEVAPYDVSLNKNMKQI